MSLFIAISLNQNIPDILFLDLSMSAYEKENIKDGLHLAKILRKKFPLIKIIILTMHTSPLYIFSVIENIEPEAFLLKSDADAVEINEALKNVLSDKVYYSKSAQKVVDNINKFSFCQEEMNRNILLLTSERYTNKEIAQALKISESTVEKKKAQLKQHLGIEGSNDRKMTEVLTNLKLL